MRDKSYNNDFFSWEGSISRKNYAINFFIVVSLYILLSFVNFNAFSPFIPFKFLLSAVIFMAGLLKLVLIMCALSLVYRRISDFMGGKSYKFQLIMKRLFIVFYVIPALYILCFRYFLGFMPILIQTADIAIFFILIPASLLGSIILCLVKG